MTFGPIWCMQAEISSLNTPVYRPCVLLLEQMQPIVRLVADNFAILERGCETTGVPIDDSMADEILTA